MWFANKCGQQKTLLNLLNFLFQQKKILLAKQTFL